MAYGIGRIPADIDQSSEDMAAFIAAEEMRMASIRKRRRAAKVCSRCGCMARELMSSSSGSVCPECYDDASY